MLIDDLKKQLKSVDSDVQSIQAYCNNADIEKTLKTLSHQTEEATFWQHPQRDSIMTQLHALKELDTTQKELLLAYQDNLEMLDLFAENEDELLKLQNDIATLCRSVRKFKIELFMTEPHDNTNCYLSINPGAGGTESQDWAAMLLRMFLRFCEREHFKVDILDYQAGEEAGIKSATLYIKKRNATGFLKTEEGIHRLVRISPFDSNKRRHTSFAAVSLTPEIEDAAIEINDKDLRVDTYRASGAGGQHINKTDSAVRITHLPSGIVVQCQNERSQTRNKQTAMKMLKAKLAEKQAEEKQAKEQGKEKKKIEWGSQIRSYVLHPYKMVKDHRTNTESSQPDQVLDGDLMRFIESYLILQASKTNKSSN